MKCEIHDCELEYVRTTLYDNEIWYCPECEGVLNDIAAQWEDFERWHQDDDEDEEDGA